MDENQIVESLSETQIARAKLYLSPDKVGQLYTGSCSGITELVRSVKEGSKASASILQFFGAEISEEVVLSAKSTLTPQLQAILVENAARRANALLDLSRDPPKKGVLLKFVGDGTITSPKAQVTPHENLSRAACDIVKAERRRQEDEREEKVGTIVWTAKTATGELASIASMKHVDEDLLVSYRRNPPFGILGRFESSEETVTFISPIWIWHEGW